ncbi:MAG: AAA family ATPase [Mycobacteriaceae bacterium]
MCQTASKSPGRLVVLRGNSGSGKTTTTHELRASCPDAFAWVEQDYLRRVMLQEDGAEARPVTADLMEHMVRHLLDQQRNVILEGILDARRHGEMLNRLRASYPGSLFYYFSVSLEETLRRHATRPKAAAFGEDEMRAWYRDRDPLPFPGEQAIPTEATLQQTVHRICHDLGIERQHHINPSARSVVQARD